MGENGGFMGWTGLQHRGSTKITRLLSETLSRHGEPRRGAPVGPEMALVRAKHAALEPGADPPGVRPPRRVLPLARARQRARGLPRGPARDRRAHALRARRLADAARRGARAH